MSEPKRIGKYELIEELGRGGFAAVYKARDTNLDRLVALKVLHPYWQEDFTFTARFHREAQKAASLQHPNIVTIYEAGEIETQPYIAMTYIDGVTLQALLEGERTLSYEETIDILDQVAKALDYAHSQGVVHRDIKPANIMIQPSAEGGQVFLLDFGLLKMTEGSLVLTSAGTILGSPEYMAPEQAVPEGMAEVGPAADRYALGVVAYHMLTGRVPFQGNSPGTLKAHEYDPVPPPQSFRPEIPEAAADAVEKMLAKSPEARFDTAVAFVAEVKRAIQQEKNLAPIYNQLKIEFDSKNWRAVLTLGNEIQAVDPDYREIARYIRTARARERRRRLFLGAGLVSIFTLSMLALFFFLFIYPTLPCHSSLITYVEEGENGRSLWLVGDGDERRKLVENVADVMVMGVSPDRCYLAAAVSETDQLTRVGDYPRFIGTQETRPVRLLVLSEDGRVRTTVISETTHIDAMYTTGGKLLVAVLKEANNLVRVTYILSETDGSQQVILSTTESEVVEPPGFPEELEATAEP